MSRWNPFAKTYTVKCQSGEVKTVYKNPTDAFSLSEKNIEANLSIDATTDFLQDANVDVGVRRNVKSLLSHLNNKNRELMIEFYNIYEVYKTDPCNNSEFLLRMTEKIIKDHDNMRQMELAIMGYIEVTKNGSNDNFQLAEIYKGIVDRFNLYGKDDMQNIIVAEMDRSRKSINAIMEKGNGC